MSLDKSALEPGKQYLNYYLHKVRGNASTHKSYHVSMQKVSIRLMRCSRPVRLMSSSSNVWYDRLFGTFAFQQLQPSNVVRLQGTGAKPGETVSLTAGGMTFNTIADESGTYAFHATIIPAGAAMLTVSGAAKPVMIEA